EIVVLTGHATPSEVSAHLLAADIAVLPFRDGVSLRRGSLLAVLEHGLPVVTTAPTSPEPLLDDGENVLLVREPSAGMFADSIESLWREPSRRHRLADGARGLAKKFDWDIIASQHAEMYACLSRGIGSR
ncbi:MAG TPA: glycosyltransferase, partial [Chloroflexota bacterium]